MTDEYEQLRKEVAELQQRHNSLFNQNFIAIAVMRGQRYIIEQANDQVCRIWGRRQEDVLGKPLFEALPETVGQGLEELLEGVLTSGEPYVGKNLPVPLKRDGRLETVYFDFIYVPMRDMSTNAITGITVMAIDVTD